MPPCRVYLINLDRSPDRLSAMSARLDALGLEWTRIPAVDGTTLGAPPWDGHDLKAFDRHLGKSPNPNELGCYLSHVAALRAFLGDGGAQAVILEDDARLTDELPAVLDELIARRADWDMVKLAGFHSGLPRTNAELAGGQRLVTFLGQSRGSAAYLVTRAAAESYVAKLLPMHVPYDHEFDKAWVYSLRIRGVLPFPVLAGGFSSTIGHGRKTRAKKPWYRRSSVLFYRLGVEARRLAHHLLTDRAWMRPVRRPH